MHTLSSASRTCMASASAVECTATVAMPSSLHARKIRSAISPRLAIRILSNMGSLSGEWRTTSGNSKSYSLSAVAIRAFLLNNYQRFAEFDRLAVFDENLRHGARARGRDLVHRLHGFDDQQRLSNRHLGADLDEWFGAGLGSPVDGADHRRGHHAWMLGDVGHGDRGCRRSGHRSGRLKARWHGCRDADVARDPQPQARMFDLDLGETGLVQQKCEFANKRAVAAGELCGCFIVRLARHALDPELSAG